MLRVCLTAFAAIYGMFCIWRLVCNVAIPREIQVAFVPELTAISVFWVMAPPIWFFIEYFAVRSGTITNFADFEKTKDYADYASKIWAGLLALLIALIAMKK